MTLCSKLRIAVVASLVVAACNKGTTEPGGPDPDNNPGDTAIVVSAAGNIAKCTNHNDEATAKLLDEVPGGLVLALGDNAFPDGTLASYTDCFGPTWGRHLDRIYAMLGNHDYTAGNADGAADYFGETHVGPRGQYYYSFDQGAWHFVVLNDNAAYVPWEPGSTQDQWLQADLAANTRLCTMVMYHDPAFLSSNEAGFTVRSTKLPLWAQLNGAGVDVVLNGSQHHYERMAPMGADGSRNDETGIRMFNVGTGGESLIMPNTAIHPNSEIRAAVYGVLRMTLRADGYDWSFVSVAGQTFSDTGTGTCH